MSELPRYQVIYTDPPWRYERGGVQGAIEYPTMTDMELAAMRPQIDTWADEDCVLFMWGTWPRLDWAMELIPAWGFEFVTLGFMWVKTKSEYHPGQLLMACPRLEDLCYMGLGFHARGNTEFCLLAKRGKPGIFAERNIPQLVFEPRREHSRKPDEVRRRIEIAYPEAARLEMFARERAPGWDAWGNEVGKFGSVDRGDAA